MLEKASAGRSPTRSRQAESMARESHATERPNVRAADGYHEHSIRLLAGCYMPRPTGACRAVRRRPPRASPRLPALDGQVPQARKNEGGQLVKRPLQDNCPPTAPGCSHRERQPNAEPVWESGAERWESPGPACRRPPRPMHPDG
jgi:hypothetical protein